MTAPRLALSERELAHIEACRNFIGLDVQLTNSGARELLAILDRLCVPPERHWQSILEAATHVDDRDAAAKLIQDALKLTTGGVMELSLPEPEVWKNLRPQERVIGLGNWLIGELACVNCGG